MNFINLKNFLYINTYFLATHYCRKTILNEPTFWITSKWSTSYQGRYDKEVCIYWPTDSKEKIIFASMACKADVSFATASRKSSSTNAWQRCAHFCNPREIYNSALVKGGENKRDDTTLLRRRSESATHARTREGNYALDHRVIMRGGPTSLLR